jgi:hypothetical protein
MKFYSAVVSQVVPQPFAALAEQTGELPGQELTADRFRLKVHDRVGDGLDGAVRYAATLRTASVLLPPIKVEVVISPWSADQSDVAIHPMTNLGRSGSLRANRFFEAARTILPAVIDRLSAGLPVEGAVPVGLAA